MDLRHLATKPTEEERASVDALLGAHADLPAPSALREARGLRHLLLPALHAIQARFGWVTPGALGYLCERIHVPPAEAYGVATFYALFSMAERPPVVTHICDDIACAAAGAEGICAELEETFGPAGKPVAGATWLRSPCLGLCERAPAAMLTVAGPKPHEGSWTGVTAASVRTALETKTPPDPGRAPVPQRGVAEDRFPLRLLARVGVVDPTSLDAYLESGGYEGLRAAFERGPAEIIREVTESGLVGRGGAAFPTGRKWAAVAGAPAKPHYLVCNADESEPGTFKDRVLMEEDPFVIIESMTIAALAFGAERGFIYVRGEYPLAVERLEHAIAEARARGFLGDNVMGKGLIFDLDLRKGAGAYICGEETALFASLEGFRGEPRTKPPFPVEVGLFGRPTVVNNVETLANVPFIVKQGAAAYRSLGTQGSPGTRLFCVSGRVARPGIYELPFGANLRDLIELAGPPEKLQAILLGGAAGTFVGPSELDLPLTFEDTRKTGTTLGSGVVLVLDDKVPMARVLERIAKFFREESCGQCVPCRVGTVRQEELLTRIGRGKPHGSIQKERALLKDLGQGMRDASICGLGQTASSAIESAVARGLWLRDEVPS
ncbi:MAG: NADH-quinone oxidoreductase subunit E [Polyangiaceae bacterium]|nr:NADH-quinone oxidoreductase subunit E [Polyangiaceae bacterium]